MEKYKVAVHVQEVGESEKITGVYIKKGDVLICDFNLTDRNRLKALTVEKAQQIAEIVVGLLNEEQENEEI